MPTQTVKKMVTQGLGGLLLAQAAGPTLVVQHKIAITMSSEAEVRPDALFDELANDIVSEMGYQD